MNFGKFITYEGIDGSGKTTQAKMLYEYLIGLGFDVILTREPGGTRFAEAVRKILLSHNDFAITPKAELMLYLAARAQLVDEVILPALKSGKWVISDRFFDSSVAYQGFARGLDPEEVMKTCLFATGGVKPDLTFFLDVSPETAAERMAKSGKKPDRLEAESREFTEKVRAGYLWIAGREPERFVVIDGEGSIESVFERIKNRVKEII